MSRVAVKRSMTGHVFIDVGYPDCVFIDETYFPDYGAVRSFALKDSDAEVILRGLIEAGVAYRACVAAEPGAPAEG